MNVGDIRFCQANIFYLTSFFSFSYSESLFMSVERTLSIVKPDAVRKNVIGKILDRFETGGLKVIACKMLLLTRDQAEGF